MSRQFLTVGPLSRLLRPLLLLAVVAVPPGIASAAVTITLANGVANPPPNLTSTGLNPQQVAIADTATLVPVADFGGILQSVLTAQAFSNANNWTLNTALLTLDANATFHITQYELFLNPAGTAFGENFAVTLNPNLTGPTGPFPEGTVVTQHWLQILNEDQKYGGFGYAIANQPGFWQVDNGDVAGGAVSATNNGSGTNNGNNGPYYDSNNNSAVTNKTYSVPPTFFDGPKYYSGVGTYLHFIAIPVWDLYTPATDTTAASSIIYTADYGIAWGFRIEAVPEPGSVAVWSVLIVMGVVWSKRRRRNPAA